MLELNKIYNEDCLEGLKKIDTNSIDSLISDPPYSLSFMSKEWDTDLPSVDILKECKRVLKSGAFALWLMTPRQDSQLEFLKRLDEAGFVLSFSPLYWAYATGFPKALNVGKAVAKRGMDSSALQGAFAGFQPKPAVEVILVGMKPLNEKSYLDQAIKNAKGVTWLNNCRIPFKHEDSIIAKNPHTKSKGSESYRWWRKTHTLQGWDISHRNAYKC